MTVTLRTVRRADQLLADLEQHRRNHDELAVAADMGGDYKRANIHRVNRDALGLSLDLIRVAMPGIIEEARVCPECGQRGGYHSEDCAR